MTLRRRPRRPPLVITALVLPVLLLAVAGCAPTTDVAGAPVATVASGTGPGGSSAPGEPVAGPAVLDPCPASVSAAAGPAVSGGLPDLSLPCLDPGRGPATVRLAGLRGRPLVVNVWGSWCVPCRAEMPVLGRAARQAGDRVRFLGVDVEDGPAAARAFAVAAAVAYNSVVDAHGETRAGLRWVGLPTTLFVRPDGVVAYRLSGPVTDQAQLAELVRTHLGVSL